MRKSIRWRSLRNNHTNRKNVSNKNDNEYKRNSTNTAITTSRRASARIKTFAKELAFSLNATRINRGKASIEEFLILSRESNIKRVIFVDGLHGNPSRLRIYDATNTKLLGFILIKSITLWRELQNRIRFRPKGVVMISEGDPLESIISDMLNMTMVRQVREVPQGFGALSLIIGKDLITLRFIHVKTLKDFGPIIRIRGIIKGEERVFSPPFIIRDEKNEQ
ncbi:MAG: hypothetical protein QW128_06120 [Thermoprotei archaeon]